MTTRSRFFILPDKGISASPVPLDESSITPAGKRQEYRAGRHASTRPAAPRGLILGAALCTALSFCMGLQAMLRTHLAAIGPYGLIQALPIEYFLALATLTVGFILLLACRTNTKLLFVLQLIVLIFLLQAPPSVIEPTPRFATAWLTAGFTDFVSHTGRVLPLRDARFSWPAFFAAVGMLVKASGVSSSIVLLRWWPLILNLLYLPPFAFLARRLLSTNRQVMVATWLLPAANWVGQDYFSPQSIAFLVYLALLCVVLGPLGQQRQSLLPWRGRESRNTLPPLQWRSAVVWLLTVLLLDAALVTGHQLTPVVAVLTVLLLQIVGRTSLRAMSLIMALLTGIWICYAAVSFWAGHFSAVFGQVGQVSGNVQQALGGRFHGTAAHEHVLDIRVGLGLLIWGLAALGLVTARRRGHDVRAMAMVYLAPFAVLAGQSYGGEAGLRVFLLSLPGALPLVVSAASRLSVRWQLGAAVALSAVLMAAFPVARWGNELYEQTRPDEIAGAIALYRIAPAGATLQSLTSNTTWVFEKINSYHYVPSSLDEYLYGRPRQIASELEGNPKGAYIIITRDQILFAEQVYGLPPNWATTVETRLTKRYFKLVYSNPDTRILELMKR